MNPVECGFRRSPLAGWPGLARQAFRDAGCLLDGSRAVAPDCRLRAGADIIAIDGLRGVGERILYSFCSITYFYTPFLFQSYRTDSIL
ncbi:MAG: hypothetical protein AB9879_12030 [Methanothrix sp.]